MKLISNIKTESYHDIEVQNSFLWFKWNIKYRKVGNTVFRFKAPNVYYNIGILEYLNIRDLFKAIPQIKQEE